ncbi:amidohydrolase family protein [Streptomyces gilvus]|uniref:amidohydrolase family protein n=1 Tax=Streptomyces gilvus TaxID=2920937 RepID=UPI001F10E7B8|nr:amidohydrolase family protein [Streptomyces sp. CME 23]MCH5675642.1 amidohydrolase [Streptomyces sp. CME 23]
MALTPSTPIISVDDHIIEPPDVWQSRLPARYREAGPRIVERGPRELAWSYQGQLYPLLFQGNTQTRKFREGGDGRGADLFARHYDDMIDAAYDVDARVAAMDRDGVHAQLLFPTFPRFAGTRFLEGADRDVALASVIAWNDWILDEICAKYPDRFIPQVILPLWDPALAAAEIRRTAEKGARSVAFCENPSPMGLPSLPSGQWAPVFAAAEETEVVLSMHIGTSGSLPQTSPEAPDSVGIALCGVNSMLVLGELTLTDTILAYPKLRIALSEGGAGWLPYALERLDYTWARSRYEGVQQKMKPSEIYRRNFWTCIIADRAAVVARDVIGVDKLMLETDFPHNDSNFPNSRKVVSDMLADVPEDEARMIAETNARSLYRFPARSS